MNAPQTQNYEFGDFRVDTTKRLLIKGDGESVPLTPKVFDLLLYLVRHAGKLIEKDELMTEIWADTIVEENNLSQNISILRRALGEQRGENRFIATVPGRGYKFVASVEVSSAKFQGPSSVESEISNPEFQNESQNKSEPETRNLKPETNQDRRPKTEDRKTSRFWIAAFAVLSIFTIGATGFYLWRENAKNAAADAPVKTVAVLPFKPLVLENRNEALELGMADTLISKLSGGEEVIVRPFSAVRRYGSLEQDSLTAGRELGVESVLDGTIQTWGDRLRISAKLLRTSDGKQLWAGQFDEKFTDIFVVQDSISERVAAALKIRLGSNEQKRSTENIEAYQLYMKGRYHYAKLKLSEFQTAISYFQQAIEIDPGYALAYANLSVAYRSLSMTGEVSSTEFLPNAKAAALKAIEIDDTLAEGYAALGSIMFWYEWDWNAAENQYRRALALNPNNADTHLFYAHLLSNTGRHAEALAEVKRVRELNPLALGINALEGQFLIHAGRTDEALDRLQKTAELEPNFWMPHFFASSAYIEKGMFAEAIAESRKEKELSGGNVIPFGAYALAKSGKPAEARAVLEELLKLSTTRYVPPYNIALVYNGLEERDETLAWLERAYRERDPKMTFLKVEPKWSNLRNEPRFIDLMRRMNFE